MRFVGIIGDAGSGKTTFMTAILYKHHLLGENIVANYKLNFPYTVMRFDKLATLPTELEGTTAGMDELGKGADSYDFFSKKARGLADLVMQSRKMHCRMFYTVQRFGLIAARLRAQTESFFLMQDLDSNILHCKCAPNHQCTCGAMSYKCKRIFSAAEADDIGRIVRTKVFDGRSYGQLFDTDEIVI